MPYTIQRAAPAPTPADEWRSAAWQVADIATIDFFSPKSSDHHPLTQVRLLYDETHLYVRFRIEDQFIRAVHTQHQQPVCEDSCAEFFVQPHPDFGYFNFEVNCGGTMLLYYIESGADDGGKDRRTEVSDDWLSQLAITHTLAGPIVDEIIAPTTWEIAYAIPVELFRAYIPPLVPLGASSWRGNFYKCGDKTSHPHWGMWSPITNRLSFHQPALFDDLTFAQSP